MTRITNDFSDIPERYREDVKTIVESCQRKSLIVTPQEAYSAWSEYSDSYAAGWLGLPYPFKLDGQDDGREYTQENCDEEITRLVEMYGNKNEN